MELEFTSDDTMTAVEAKIAREKAHLLISGCPRLDSSGGSPVPDPVGYSESVSDPMGHSEFIPGGTLGGSFPIMERIGELLSIEEEEEKEEVNQKPPSPPFILALIICAGDG